jgi:biotin carboxyl carrier protein
VSGGGAADPRAVRIRVEPATALDGDPTVVVAPAGDGSAPADPLVDGQPVLARLAPEGRARAHLIRGETDGEAGGGADGEAGGGADGGAGGGADGGAGGGADGATRTAVLLGEERPNRDGSVVREVVVRGWRFELRVESERRASLRDRAARVGGAAGAGGPLEIRAIIPGRIVAVTVAVGDEVTTGQQVLVLEAMKMQNELRAPRDGRIAKVVAVPGANVEVGDPLLVIE